MNTETKRHIDAARQVLVGVVPNPTSQIDQITNALIYKFMDDMDQAAIKQGGDPSFFVGDLEQYAWTRLMDARIGNQQRMNIYSEALVKFSESKQLPQLFREIFKSAFLPYRSPEVLGLFLKEIDYFDYSHPEELGNAYEYLLSIMSSQGDAGQFRTPRHIIDFMVDVVDPTVADKVLDPACGTGGFLVSAYKHILEQHDGKNDKEKKEKPLTPDQRKNLMGNFEGYDIDPGMVRIAQVNMYLHQFKNPKIYNYDSLSMDERWGDKFSIILANPPFMSPKGGVSTHSKFSIKSTRSEVLFVDYIMNHLRPQGRAAIIVPEGIIFQTGTAHKQLRKNLVEDGLYAVVSLPSGVFQPYSGVKTSVLLFNNELSKQKNEILFVKIENDGFDLGSNKKPINKNDLPEALNILNEWKKGKKVESAKAVYVEKIKISESGDYNLSVDRYRIATDFSNAKWPMVGLLELEQQGKIEFLRGQGLSKSDLKEEGKNKCIHYGEIYTLYEPFIKHVISKTDFNGKILSLKGDVLVPATTTADAMGIAVARSLNEGGVILGGDINIIRTKNKFILSDYLSLLISNPPLKIELARHAKGANILHLSNSDLKRLQIPLPPIEIQNHMVAKLKGYQNIISGAKQMITNWKPRIDINPQWERVSLGEVCLINPKKSEIKNLIGETVVSFVPMSDLGQNETYFKVIQSKKLSEVSGSYTYFAEDDVLLARVTPCFENGKAGIAKNLTNGIGFGSSEYIVLRSTEKILPEIIYAYVTEDNFKSNGKEKMTGTGGLQRVPGSYIQDWIISLPPLEIQKQIVENIKSERAIIDANKKLIEIYEQKTKDTIAKLWKE